MILAAPLVIPFAEAIGLSVATLGIAKASDMVNEYIQENPEQSMKIFQMIMPSQGIANALKNKSSDEEVEEDVEVEEVDTRDLTRAEKAKMMKELAKSGGGNMREKMKKGYEEIIQPGESDRELDDAEDRYDGGVEDAPKPKFDYKKFFKKRYADGGSIGIEVLFEPKRDNFRKGGDTMGGKNDKSKTSKGPDRSAVGPGSTYANNVANQNDGGGGITNTINNINKPTVFDKVKNTVNKVVDNPLTTFLDPRSKLALAMGGYRYLRDGVTPFQQKSIDDELESIQTRGGISPYADGGRVGLFMGGSPLTGQALSIYNSMNAYGFDDQAIADALMEQGLYTPVNSTPVVEEPVTNIAPNIINQGGDGGITNFSGGPTGSSFFGGLNKNDYEADAYGIGPTFSGSFARTKQGLTNFASALKNIPTPINLARMAYESYQQKQIEKRAQEEAIARDIARDMQESNRAGKTGGYQAGYDRDFMDGPSGGGGNTGGSPGSSGPGGSDSMGSFARGGLAAMFKKKR